MHTGRGSGPTLKYNSSRMLWMAHELFYPGKSYMYVLCKDMVSCSTCQRPGFPMGTLQWKASQILSQKGLYGALV